MKQECPLWAKSGHSQGKMPGPRHRPKRIIRCAGNSKIKTALLVYGYSNLTWASPYGVLRAK
jgi:hypothetical protein